MSRGWFVTGTDTGVGKTVISACLLKIFLDRGVNAAPMKPVQTGCAEGGIPDLDYVCRQAGFPARLINSDMAPYCYQDPCSPHLAAIRENRSISLTTIRRAFGHLQKEFDAVVAEGAGGVLVPLNTTETMRDIIRAFGLDVVLVSRPGLGTLNHTLLSIQALQEAGCRLAAIVINPCPPEDIDYIRENNITTLREKAPCPVIAGLPHVNDLNSRDGFNSFYKTAARELSVILD